MGKLPILRMIDEWVWNTKDIWRGKAMHSYKTCPTPTVHRKSYVVCPRSEPGSRLWEADKLRQGLSYCIVTQWQAVQCLRVFWSYRRLVKDLLIWECLIEHYPYGFGYLKCLFFSSNRQLVFPIRLKRLSRSSRHFESRNSCRSSCLKGCHFNCVL